MKKRKQGSRVEVNKNMNMRKLYALCRRLGMSAGEASRASKRTKSNIKKLAKKLKSGVNDAELELLGKRVRLDRDRLNDRRRKLYALCKKLGFTGLESAKLCKSSETNIRKIAKKRKKKR